MDTGALGVGIACLMRNWGWSEGAEARVVIAKAGEERRQIDGGVDFDSFRVLFCSVLSSSVFVAI